MTPGRRCLLYLGVGAATLLVVPRLAIPQSYPTRPVHLIVGFPAGGSVDLVSRVLAQGLSKRLDQPFVVEDRPGAASKIATEEVVRASPDGYTLLTSTTANASSTSIFNFNFVHDIAPVASICRVPFVMVINPAFPAKTLLEFIAYAKAHPGKINMASAGIGTASHIAGELFNVMTGVKMVHVPYRGEPPALSDLIGGRVQVLFGTLPVLNAHIRAGELHALAVANVTRVMTLPEVPTIGEFVPGYEVAASIGISAPHDTPAEIIGKLNNEINAELVEPEIKAQLTDLGAPELALSAADYGKLIEDEAQKWSQAIQKAGVKASEPGLP
jgi:tripartite-type tricarboxylate transporter receptor subunit TctC